MEKEIVRKIVMAWKKFWILKFIFYDACRENREKLA